MLKPRGRVAAASRGPQQAVEKACRRRMRRLATPKNRGFLWRRPSGKRPWMGFSTGSSPLGRRRVIGNGFHRHVSRCPDERPLASSPANPSRRPPPTALELSEDQHDSPLSGLFARRTSYDHAHPSNTARPQRNAAASTARHTARARSLSIRRTPVAPRVPAQQEPRWGQRSGTQPAACVAEKNRNAPTWMPATSFKHTPASRRALSTGTTIARGQ